MLGFYEKAIPAMRDALHRYIAATHPLADAPSIRLCRIALMDVEDIAKYGAQAVLALVTPEQRRKSSSWLALLDVCLAAAGGLDGSGKGDGVRADALLFLQAVRLRRRAPARRALPRSLQHGR